MKFIKALKTDFEAIGVPITTEIQLDGKYIKHVEHLTSEQINYTKDKPQYEFIDQIHQQEGE